MEIRTRIILSVFASLLVSGMIILLIFSTIRGMEREAARNREYGEILKRTDALNLLASRLDPFSYPSRVRQIREIQRALEDHLGTIGASEPREERLLRQIRIHSRELGYFMEKLVPSSPPPGYVQDEERRTVLLYQLWTKTQFIHDDTRSLIELSQSRLAHAQRRAVVWMILGIIALTLANAAISYASGRKIVQTQERLRESEVSLRKLVDEKEVLLKEVHHRVKNNLQVISSLLSLQADELESPEVRSIFQDVTHRVRSIAMVHEKLYRSRDLARVEFSEYAKDLLHYLWRAHGAESMAIRLLLDLESVELPVGTAVPVGLILNELVSNALKHAFPGGAGGEVAVSFRRGEGGKATLCVRDNGIGLPAGFDPDRSHSLGLRLVRLLAVQLRADLRMESDGGSMFTITLGEES